MARESAVMNSDNEIGRGPLPKAARLTHPSEFARVRETGAVVRGKLLVLGFLEVAGSAETRSGFVTSKRVGNAVIRNRIRRRLREIYRLHRSTLRAGFWLVVIARAPAANASYRALEDEWLRLANRASLVGR
jgi:ribonuclease P protein component